MCPGPRTRQGQFPKGSIRPRGYMAPDARRSFAMSNVVSRQRECQSGVGRTRFRRRPREGGDPYPIAFVVIANLRQEITTSASHFTTAAASRSLPAQGRLAERLLSTDDEITRTRDYPIAMPLPTVRLSTCVVFSMRSAAALSAAETAYCVARLRSAAATRTSPIEFTSA